MCAVKRKKFCLVVGVCTVLSLGAMDLQEEKSCSPKFCYDRDQLLALRNSPLSFERPIDLPNVPGVTLSEQEKPQSPFDRIKELKSQMTYDHRSRPKNPAYSPTITALGSLIALLEGRISCKRKHAELLRLDFCVAKGFAQLCKDRRCPDWFKHKATELEGLLDVVLTTKSSARVCKVPVLPKKQEKSVVLDDNGFLESLFKKTSGSDISGVNPYALLGEEEV